MTESHTVDVVQYASTVGDERVLAQFIEALEDCASPPFDGPDAWGRFGRPPRAIRVFVEAAEIVIECPTREPAVANEALSRFLAEVGYPAAERLGLSLAVSPATIPLPPEVVRQPLHAPELGALNPKYRAHFPRSGSPTFVFEGWRSEPRVLEALGGHVVSFSVDEPLSVEDAKAVGPVIRRLVAADETLRTAFADALFERYSAYCARFEPDELIDYGIPVIATPVDVWDHVGLDRRPRVVPSARPAPGAVSEGAAYVEFHCGCAWDREHGVRIVVDDRMQGLAGEDGKQ